MVKGVGVLTNGQKQRVCAMYLTGTPVSDIVESEDIRVGAIYSLLKRNGIKPNRDNRPENLMVVQRENHYGFVTCPHCGKEFAIK